jgi:serine O-acetyltransferase
MAFVCQPTFLGRITSLASDIRLKEQLPQLTEEIVATYSPRDSINHLGHCALPSYRGVAEILRNLNDVLFPGYHGKIGLHAGNIRYHVGGLIDLLHDQLTTEIARALRHENRVTQGHTDCESDIDFDAKGQAMAIALLKQIPRLRQTLATDVQAAYDGDPACQTRDEVVFCYPGFAAVAVYRIAHELVRLGVPFIPRMMTEWAHKQTGIDIHPGATIGDYFFIDHGTGVVIGETCEIGQHVKLYQGVTLGALSFPTDSDGQIIRGNKRHPTIEDRVVVYANATILGGQTVIGHDSVIGSSVWITKTVSPNTTVLLESPQLKVRGGASDAEVLGQDLNFQI